METKIELTISPEQKNTLKKAFPELEPEECALKISEFATSEIIELLAGHKRYLSLSHQYIEWLEQINVNILPDVEFTPSRIMNQFNFPPGSASYISRILRDRQHTVLIEKSTASLKKKFKEIIDEYEALSPKERGNPGKHYSISLSKRELRLLQIKLDEHEEKQQGLPASERKSINYPETSEVRMDYIKIKYTYEIIERINELLNK